MIFKSSVSINPDLKYVYTKPSSYSITIHYKYPDGSQAHEDYVGSVAVGDPYSIPSPSISGYTPDKPTVSGTMPESDVEATVTYTANNYALTIYYQYPDGTEAAPTHTETLQKGASYNVPSPEVEGYLPDKPTVSGTMPVSDQAITVTYNPRPYDLTIHYQYEDGTEAAPSHTSQVPNGTPYSVPSPTITGYLPDKETVSDTMPPFDDTVTVTYVENPARLTVGMYYEDGQEITTPIDDLITIGSSFEFTLPVFGDYEPDIAKIEDRMPVEGASYAVMYSARAASSGGMPGLSSALLNDPVINPYASKTGPNYLAISPDRRYLFLCNNSTRTLDGWKYSDRWGELFLDPKGGSYDIYRFDYKNGQWVLRDKFLSFGNGVVTSQGISCGPAGGGGSTPSNHGNQFSKTLQS